MKKKIESIIECEKNIITIILLRFDYLIYSFDNYVDDTPLKLLLHTLPNLVKTHLVDVTQQTNIA